MEKENMHEKVHEEENLIETVEDWNDKDQERIRSILNEEESPDPQEEDPMPRPAAVEVVIENGDMRATLYVHPPLRGGPDVEQQDIEDELLRQGIVFGINREKITEIAEQKQYRQLFEIAAGKPPVDGSNGKIKDFFPREHKLKFSSKSNGGIDFKNLNLIHNVQKGTVVCEITRPTEPEDGMDILGRPVHGQRGKMPEIPQGRNIVYSEDRLKLVASCEGNLTFRSGRFQVENVYSVEGNVDNSIGNIDFSGSVYIKGDVFEGYTVKARGDITVVGIVEGAHLESGGDIILHKGMRGMKKGILEAKGNITGKFLEDSTIRAQGSIQAEYIINSRVSCNKDLTLMGRRGALIGGSCAVFNRLRVKNLGSASQTSTAVALGITPELLEETAKVQKELKNIQRSYEDCVKNVEYLTNREETGRLTEAQKLQLSEFKIQIPVNRLKITQLKKRRHELEQLVMQVGKSRLEADLVYPGTVITMGESKLIIKRVESMCMFYYMDGEIKRGTF